MKRTNPELDERYRAEGWGQITDATLNIPPSDVESQAREVARHAYRLQKESEALRAIVEELAYISSFEPKLPTIYGWSWQNILARPIEFVESTPIKRRLK